MNNRDAFFLPFEDLKKEIVKLDEYLSDLKEYERIVEEAQVNTVQQIVLKEFAYLQDTSKVAAKMNDNGFTIDANPFSAADIVRFIKSDGDDLLHRVIRLNYWESSLPKLRMSALFPEERPDFIKW
ncbi:hypothetical protein [Psychrobacillus sp. FJAT-21963]|uniref:hypothetical protein n=1 Tax=Psychrobacillus sp. FJAT-21963 TaxID=1712028 RepID=UPI0006FF8C79|nr:hypothetical protein [Psychrobacillus sp. FJAT-21963]KQL33346.1 hypothetical protein AN959_17445 [Psychrobacillus sp. FJAT-21963]